jgi:hypothetical protein
MTEIMNSLHRIFSYSIILAALAVVVSACKEEDPDELRLSRMFKPTGFDIEPGETSAAIRWNPSLFTMAGEVEYQIELSKDPDDFSTPEISKTSTEPEITVTDAEIDIKTDYYARVKALGANGADDSNWLVSEAFQITGQILLLTVREYDVTTDALRVRWTVEDVLTKVVLTPVGGSPAEHTITSEEATAGEKTITGLSPNTTYKVELFKGEVSKGDATFTTKNSYTGANIVDLRAITGKPKILADTLADIPSGSVVLLKRGQTYDITGADASRNLSKSVTIVSGADFISSYAKINLTSNFNIVASAVIDSIVFRDVVLRGARAGGLSFDNDYILNVNVAGTMKKVKLENCMISKLRGTVRLQTGGAGAFINNYVINNCVIDSIREFAVVMASGASAFKDVKISNSTFSHCRRYVDHRVTGNLSLSITNCTLNDVPTGSLATLAAPTNYLIDYNTFSPATPIVITNTIFGRSWVETAGSQDVGGIRGGASTTVNVTNSYTLSDFVSGNATYKLPGVIGYPGSSTSVFLDPNAEDFHIKDAAFPGALTAGDPRWR